MKRFSTSILVLALFGAPAFTACGDDEITNNPGFDTIFPDAVGSDIGDTATGNDSSNPQIVKVFDFEQAFGDDSRPCRSQDRCAIFISFSEQRTLKLKYTEDGQPVAGQVVKFVIENDRDNLGFINTQSAVTDASGIVQVNTKARVGQVGQFVVKAFINDQIPAKFFDVVVSPKGQVPLTVVGTYNGTRAVGSYQVSLYPQTNGAPACGDLLDLLENQTARYTRNNVLMNQSAKFPDIEGLENAGDKVNFTILVYALNNASPPVPVAWGCDSTGAAPLEFGQSKTVQVELFDRPPIYEGAYTITSYFDFISAIPEPIQGYVRAIFRIFENPVDGIYQLVCVILNDQDNQFCEFRNNIIGQTILDTVNQIILALLPENIRNIFTLGADISDILEKFEVDEIFNIRNEPDSFGNFAPGDIFHKWVGTRFRWRFNQGCPPESTTCGVTQLSLNQIGQDVVEGSAAGSVANFWDLTIATHSINLKYGAFLSGILQVVAFPLITGSDQVRSYESLLQYLFGGGAECLNTLPSCCERFGTQVAPDNATLRTTATAGCNAVVTLVPNTLSTLLNGLTLNSSDAFTLATKVPCALEDTDNDMIVDRIGSPNNRCEWDAKIRFNQNATTTITATFSGNRNQ
jgi:hypothetical protein